MRHALRAGTAQGGDAQWVIRALDHARRHGGRRVCGLAPSSRIRGQLRLKVHKNRIAKFRRTRNRSGLMIAALVVLTLLVLRSLVG